MVLTSLVFVAGIFSQFRKWLCSAPPSWVLILQSYFLPLTLICPFLSVAAPNFILPVHHKCPLPFLGVHPESTPTPSAPCVSRCLESQTHSLTVPRPLCICLIVVRGHWLVKVEWGSLGSPHCKGPQLRIFLLSLCVCE